MEILIALFTPIAICVMIGIYFTYRKKGYVIDEWCIYSKKPDKETILKMVDTYRFALVIMPITSRLEHEFNGMDRAEYAYRNYGSNIYFRLYCINTLGINDSNVFRRIITNPIIMPIENRLTNNLDLI